MTECDEIVIVMDNLSTKKTNTLATKKTNTTATNVTFTVSSNYLSKKARDCYILHTVSITIDNYYYLLSLCKTKRYNIKWKIMIFKKFVLKIVRVIISVT